MPVQMLGLLLGLTGVMTCPGGYDAGDFRIAAPAVPASSIDGAIWELDPEMRADFAVHKRQ